MGYTPKQRQQVLDEIRLIEELARMATTDLSEGYDATEYIEEIRKATSRLPSAPTKSMYVASTSKETKTAQSLFDIIFPKQQRQQAGLSDDEAGLIYQMWKMAPTGSQAFKVPANTDMRTIVALKDKGYLYGLGEGVELTEKGKKIIVEMVTHEPNAFLKHSAEVSYNGIKSKSASRPKQALKKQKTAKREESDAFNLRKRSLKRMSGE